MIGKWARQSTYISTYICTDVGLRTWAEVHTYIHTSCGGGLKYPMLKSYTYIHTHLTNDRRAHVACGAWEEWCVHTKCHEQASVWARPQWTNKILTLHHILAVRAMMASLDIGQLDSWNNSASPVAAAYVHIHERCSSLGTRGAISLDFWTSIYCSAQTKCCSLWFFWKKNWKGA